MCATNYLDCNAGGVNATNGCEIAVGAACLNDSTTGTGGTFKNNCNGTLGNCTNTGGSTAYLDCDNSDGDGILTTCHTGNGCETQNNSACTVAGLAGTYNSCTCTISNQDIATTGVKTNWSGTLSMLWLQQYGTGHILNFSNYWNQSIAIDNNTCIVWRDGTTTCTAPTGGAGGGNTTEEMQDATALMLRNTTGTTFWYDDAGNTLNVTLNYTYLNTLYATMGYVSGVVTNVTTAQLTATNANVSAFNINLSKVNVSGGYVTGVLNFSGKDIVNVKCINGSLGGSLCFV
jgi:hypothetical protein